MDFGPQRLEEYLASLTPGPELGAALGAIDPSWLCGYDAVSFLHAQYRQVAHEQGRMLLAVSHVARCGFDEGQHAQRMSSPDEWSSQEVKAVCGLTRNAGEEMVALAWNAVDRAPEVGEAMLAGELDLPRAKLLLNVTVGLGDSVQAAVLANCLPKAALSGPRAPTGWLADYAKSLAIALDPHAEFDRYRSAVQDRRVIARRNHDGTGNLEGHQLPPERVAAAAARIDVLAKAAKRDGDPRPIHHLRAEIFMCLTEGTWIGLDDTEILAALRTTRPAAAADTAAKPAPAARPLDGVELRLRLTTALGIATLPGELAGFGPLPGEHARAILASLGQAQWRWVLLDQSGHLVRAGLTPVRPTGVASRSADCTSIVDLHVSELLLRDWARYAHEGQRPSTVDPDTWAAWRRLIVDIDRRAAQPPPPPGDPNRRFANAHLRREVQTAHGRCIGVGCRAPASRADLDHVLDRAKNGRTTRENSAPACRRDHVVKHQGGWALERVEGGYRWISRLRHVYDVPVPPVVRDLPDPHPDSVPPCNLLPEPDGDRDTLYRHWEFSGVWENAGPEPSPF